MEILKFKKISDYVCSSKGGEGAFREMADLILKLKKLVTSKFFSIL